MNMNIVFGALAPRLSEQLNKQGLTATFVLLDSIQRDADAISRLSVRGVLTESSARAAHRKLVKRLVGMVQPITKARAA